MNRRLLTFVILTCIILLAVVFFTQKRTVETNKEPVDVKICDDIETYDLKVTCLAIFTNDPSRCKDAGNFDSYCYESVFGAMNNFSEPLCKSFSDYFPRTTCYLVLAMIEKDPSLCENSGGRFQQCSWELAKITKDSKLCEEIEADFEKYECLAEVTRDVSFCEKISPGTENSGCFIKLGKNVDIKKCGEVVPIENPSYSYVQECIANVAKAKKDASICNMIESKEAKWKCLTSLSKSMDICKEGENQFWEDFCKIEYIKIQLGEKI